MDRPTIGGGGATTLAPGAGEPPGPGSAPGCGRVSRPNAISPTITKSAATTMGGMENARPSSGRRGLGDGDTAGRAPGPGGVASDGLLETTSESASEVAVGASSWSTRAPSSTPARAGPSSMSATLRPHFGQKGIPATRAVPQRGQNRGPESVIHAPELVGPCYLCLTTARLAPCDERGWPPGRRRATIDPTCGYLGGRWIGQEGQDSQEAQAEQAEGRGRQGEVAVARTARPKPDRQASARRRPGTSSPLRTSRPSPVV